MERSAALCEDCKVPCNDFKKILDHKSSGLAIYAIQNNPTSTVTKKSNDGRNSESFILHNTSKKDIKKKDFASELNQYKTKCSCCKTLVHKVKSLLVDLSAIKQDEVRGVCIHCQRRNLAGKCKRCEQIVHRYVTSKVQQYEESQTRITDWINRIRDVLKSLLERDSVCRHNMHHESSSAEIQRLFQELKPLEAPYQQRLPKIYDFPGSGMPCFKGKDSTVKEPRSSNQMATSCVCKYFMDKNIEGRGSMEVLFKETEREPGITFRDTERKKDYRFDSEERDFRYSGRHERDIRYPGRDDRNHRYTGRDDKDYPYESHDKVYRYPGVRENDFLSLGRDDRHYRFSEIEDIETRGPGRDNRDYPSPGRNDKKNYRDTHGHSRYDRDSNYAGKEKKERLDLSRDNNDYHEAGRDNKEDRHSKRDDRESRSPVREYREARGPSKEDREYRSLGRHDRCSQYVGRNNKETHHPERDAKDYRSSNRGRRQSASASDKEHPFTGGAGRANRYGRQERDIKDNEFYFPNWDDKEFRRPGKRGKDQVSPDNEKDETKPAEDDKGKHKEEDQGPKIEDKEHAEDRKTRAKEKETERENDRAREKKRGQLKKMERDNEKITDWGEEIETTEDIIKRGSRKARVRVSAKMLKKDHEKTEVSERDRLKGEKNIKEGEINSNLEKEALSKGWTVQKSEELAVVIGSKKGESGQSKDADVKTKTVVKVGIERSKENKMCASSKDNMKDKENKKPGKKKGKGDKKGDLDKGKETIEKKVKITSEERLLLKMMKERKEKREKDQATKNQKDIQIPVFEDLPEIKIPEPVIEVEVSESVIICGDQKPYRPIEMVRGSDIVPYDTHYKDQKLTDVSHEPKLFKTHQECFPAIIDVSRPMEPSVSSIKDAKIKSDKGDAKIEVAPSGIIKYQLSNREFIDKGWTVLPTTKVMRRMTIYKMLPVNPNCSWFARHISDKSVFYDTGERLAEINEDGTGQLFYKSGVMALDYYNSEDPCTNQRYVIYSHVNDAEAGETQPVTVLASFDYLGNGVVYDSRGNIRLKYNQSEGMVVDEKIGPPGVWKWHMLNDPPVLEPMFLNTQSKHPDPRVEAIVEVSDKDNKSSAKSVKSIKSTLDKSTNMMQDEAEEMIAIELENFAKAQALKLTHKFKPFQITRKIFKINDYFSLKILDQTNICLMFRDGQVSLKLNIGMRLVSTEIVDTDASETLHVPTPYDVLPPKTASLAHIQSYLMKAKRAK